MRVLVVDNSILFKNMGNYYAQSVYSYEFMKRYLAVFGEMRFVSKVDERSRQDYANMLKVSGEGVEILALPYYRGLMQMIRHLPKLIKIYRSASKDCDCIIYRIAQMESFFVYLLDRHKGKPYAVEVVNDPNTFTDMPDWMRRFSVRLVKRMAWKADGASYVTEKYLQSIFPNAWTKDSKNHFVSSYSSVDLRNEDIAEKPIKYQTGNTFRIIHVANAINSDAKGHYTLINAFNEVLKEYSFVKLVIVGDGDKLDEYKGYVKQLGIENYVEFTGHLHKKSDLILMLKKSNLMVLPTRMEGLPRTIIEAMAVGLPCLSSPTAGIPELLESKYLFLPDDYKGFADAISQLIKKPAELEKMSNDNIETAKKYTDTILNGKRTEFYRHLRDAVEEK